MGEMEMQDWISMHYMTRQFFAPVLISGVEDKEAGTVEIHLTSDRLTARDANVSWTITDVIGTVLDRGDEVVETPANASRVVKTLNLKGLLADRGPANVLVWLEAVVEGEPVQRNLVLFAPPKRLEISPEPDVRHTVTANHDGSFSVVHQSKDVALWTWIELKGIDATLSNNFFHLRPGTEETVVIYPDETVSVADLKSMMGKNEDDK